MKASWFVQALCTWLLGASMAAAQTLPPGPPHRLDLHASVGGASVSADNLGSADDWDNAVAQGIVGLGWYWTDHLKTEVDVRFASAAQFYGFEESRAGGRVVYRSSRFRLGTSSVSLGQYYQFFRNAWVHPYLGAGVDLRRGSLEEWVDPVMAYDEVSRQYAQVAPALRLGPSVSWSARPLVLAGLKAYVSRRVFFRTDARVGFGSDVDEVVVSAGFGVDF